MSVRHYALGNIGRDKGPKSSNRIDLDALLALRVNIPDEQSAIFLCEINEGDDNNEMALVRTTFKGWRVYGAKTREPILLSPDQPRAKSNTYWVKDSAVRKWSPIRSVLVVHLADEPESLIGCHPCAGANGQGDRPSWARGPLQTSWDNTIDKMNSIKKRLHLRGRDVTTMIDSNTYDNKTYKLLPNERQVWRDATDVGRVYPALGSKPWFVDGGKVDFKIDSHDGHLMHGRYKLID